MEKEKEKGKGWYDASGTFIPKNRINDYEKKRERLLVKVFKMAEKESAALKALREFTMVEVEKLKEAAKLNKRSIGGEKGNVTIRSFGDDYKLEISAQPFTYFDERFPAALELINKCIDRWSQGSKAELVKLIRNYISPDSQGQYNVSKVLGLLKIKSTDADWNRAMELVKASYQRGKTAFYVRFSKRIPGPDKWKAIPLNIASV